MRSKRERLKDTAWKKFSIWIRKRDSYCVTHLILGKQVPSENAGHYWHNVLDFDEENINGQCVNCNKYNSGRLAEYSIYLLKKLGKKKYEALDIRHTRDIAPPKRDEQYYQDIIDKYSINANILE